MTTPEAKLEYRIERDGDKFAAIDSEQDIVGVYATEEQAQQIPEVKGMVDDPPDWLVEWSHQIGAELKDGLREGPAWIAFAREKGTVYHTYTVRAPDPFVAPYFNFLLARTPKPLPDEPRTFRKDEYPD